LELGKHGNTHNILVKPYLSVVTAFRFDEDELWSAKSTVMPKASAKTCKVNGDGPWHDCIAFSQTIYEVIEILKIAGLVLFGVFLIGCMVYRYMSKIQKIDKAANE
jgi:hypothetical protein